MPLKETNLQRSGSAVFSNGNSPKSSLSSCHSNLSCTRRSTACFDSAAIIKGESSKNTLNHKYSSTHNTLRSKTAVQERQNQTVCRCSDCTTLEVIPKHLLKELEDQVHVLTEELNKQRNDNQILKRDVLVAKKVVKNEIGVDKGEDIESLWKKACGDGWKGRQGVIFVLKRKLQDLSETIERMESYTENPPPKKRDKQKRKEDSEVFDEERTIHWCLELERQEVWRSAERDKQQLVASRNAMKTKLEPLITRNEQLMKEATNLREKLSADAKNTDEGMVENLHELENKLKSHLEEKTELRQKLDDLEQQICRNSKCSVELKTKINFERLILKNTEAKINTMKAKEAELHSMHEETKKQSSKQLVPARKKLESTEQDYNKLLFKSEFIIELIATGKQLLENMRSLSMTDDMNTTTSCSLSQCELSTRCSENQLGSRKGSKISVDILGDGNIRAYGKKMSRYMSMLEKLDHRNRHKLQDVTNISNKTKEEIFSFLKNRRVLWKLTTDIDVLGNRLKKLRRTAIYQSKHKPLKRKESNQTLTEVLGERKIFLAIRKVESKFLQMLVRHVFGSKADDCKLLERHLALNRDIFLTAASDL